MQAILFPEEDPDSHSYTSGKIFDYDDMECSMSFTVPVCSEMRICDAISIMTACDITEEDASKVEADGSPVVMRMHELVWCSLYVSRDGLCVKLEVNCGDGDPVYQCHECPGCCSFRARKPVSFDVCEKYDLIHGW
jgi:hypothetical protein